MNVIFWPSADSCRRCHHLGWTQIATTGGEDRRRTGRRRVDPPDVRVRETANVGQSGESARLRPRDGRHETVLADERQSLRASAFSDVHSPERPLRRENDLAVRNPLRAVRAEQYRCEATRFPHRRRDWCRVERVEADRKTARCRDGTRASFRPAIRADRYRPKPETADSSIAASLQTRPTRRTTRRAS